MKTEPGPGQYNPTADSQYFKKVSYSISGINDSVPKRGKRDESTPGPGSYENADTLHYKKISGSKIGKDSRKSYFL